MREIKFRAWETRKKKMFYDGDMYLEPHQEEKLRKVIDPCRVTSIGIMYEVRETDLPDATDRHFDHTNINGKYVELMQYTGLKDIDGIEIFEGDIVSDSDGNHAPVIWNQDEARFIVNYQDDPCNIWAECLVVGNIYEGVREEYL